MSYKLEGKDIVISGFENGISQDPYEGIADIRNANISSTPKEVAVNFSTTLNSPVSLASVSISSADTGTEILTITSSPTLASGMTITLTGATLPAPLAIATTYWVIKLSNTTIQLASTYDLYIAGTPINLTTTGTPGNWLFTTINMSVPKYMTTDNIGAFWMVDQKGRVWRNPTPFAGWVYTGNLVPDSSTTSGNGIVYYESASQTIFLTATVAGGATSATLADPWPEETITQTVTFTAQGTGVHETRPVVFTAGSTAITWAGGLGATAIATIKTIGLGYIFVIHNSSIDYTLSGAGTIAWNYQWNPALGTVGTYALIPDQVLNTGLGVTNPHEAIVTPNSQVVFGDTDWVDRFYQEFPGIPFVPTVVGTYVWDQTQLLPVLDIAQCITFLGRNIMIGGRLNVIYPWDGISSEFGTPIFVADSFISKMVTVNTNTYIFAGNRGRIYVTNGSNADLYKKIPDNISGTLEPYFKWGGATFQKNRLYFGFSVTDNAGNDLTSLYKGLWSVDTDTKALIGTNNLSGTNVNARAIIAINPTGSVFTTNGPGGALFIGWTNTGESSNGVDITSSTPYSNLETFILTDMIPVGTYLKAHSPSQVEWKVSYPIGSLGSAETINIAYRTGLNQSFVQIGTTTVTGTSVVSSQNGTTTFATTSGTGSLPIAVSDFYQVNFQKAQWIQLRISMSSNATTPTYCRLTEVRIRDYPA